MENPQDGNRRLRSSYVSAIISIATGAPMERATAQAFSQLILWMESDYGWDRWRAYDILTHVARTSMGYYGLGTMAAKIEKRYLERP